MYSQIENFYVCSYVSKKRRLPEMLSRIGKIANQVKLQVKFPVKKNTLTVVTNERHSTVIMPMDVHKQAIEKRNWQVEFERQAEEQKQREAPLRLCLYKLPFILDFTDKKLWIAFKFNL